MTKTIFPKHLEDYAQEHTTPESTLLYALNRETNYKVDKAVMLSGHMQGTLLQFLSHAVQPKLILELGTYTGYSALCLAVGLQPDGLLHTIEIDEELYDIARKYIVMAQLEDKIIQHTGAAADIIPTIEGSFDMVFIDADKPNYAAYYDLVIDRVRPGGLLIADNVLFEGDVTLPEEQQSKNALAMHHFNKKVKEDPRVAQMLLPIRDGLLVIRKL